MAKRRRLYAQIYVAFVTVAVLSAVAAGTVAWLWAGDEWRGVPPPIRSGATLLESDLRRDGLPAVQARAEQLGLHLTLRDPSGGIVAHHGPVLGTPNRLAEGWGRWRRRKTMTVRMSDGRWLTGALAGPHSHARPGRHLGMLAILLLAAAAGCYPLARRLTRRLEALRTQVSTFGAGDLSARVEVGGRADEVAELGEAFNSAAARIEQLVASERRVLASASHELRSPLARLRMALELLDDPDLPGERRAELVADSAADIEELDELVGDLLQAGRLRSGGAERRAVELTALVSRALDRAGATWVDEPPELTVDGDAKALRALVRNLLDNARRHGGGGDVEVSLQAGDDQAILTVSDRGPGVASDDAERIWEPFYRPAGHREAEDGGVGLGLALVREIAEGHGGSARHYAREGGGTTFEVRIASPRP